MNHPFKQPRHRYWLHFEQKCRFNFSNSQITRSFETSLRANGSRECAPDDRLREAIHRPRRHCERSEAIHLAA